MMKTNNEKQGIVDVAGHVNKVKEDLIQIDPKVDIQHFHLRSIGKLIEQNEGEIRGEMNGIYINKSK